MKNTIAFKALVAMLLTSTAFFATAQTIQENELKTNVSSIEKPVEKLQNLEPIYYSFNTDKLSHLKLTNAPQYGFKLQSAKTSFPDLIRTNNKSYTAGKNHIRNATYQDLETENLIPVLVAAIQEQQIAIEALKKEVAELKSKK
ncbi:MAG TPA: tail fiber domain-containing protein [Pelobium sp.]|nr:tail fiber domain-containing protein [Pelobium sp.]